MTNSETDTTVFEKTDRNQVRQAQKRGHYDRETVYAILDASLLGNVAFASDGVPFIIPMLFARKGDELLFHGSTKSRLMNLLSSGQPVCVSTTLVDGLVMAKSLMHHSMNYRSVCVFGSGAEVTDPVERMEALKVITDKTVPGRWEDARQPNAQEMKATKVVAVKIESASAKVRSGAPIDDKEDLELPVWTGVLPLIQQTGAAIANPNDQNVVPMPDYVRQWQAKFNDG